MCEYGEKGEVAAAGQRERQSEPAQPPAGLKVAFNKVLNQNKTSVRGLRFLH